MSESTLQIESCNLKAIITGVPTTQKDWDALAGEDGYLMYDAALDHIKFHDVMTSFRRDMMKAVKTKYPQYPPNTKPHPEGKLNEKKEPIMVEDEKPATYLARVAAALGAPNESVFQELADAWAKENPFSEFLKSRPKGEGLIGKRDLALAAEILQDAPRLKRNIKQFRQKNIECVDEPTVEQLGLAIKELRAKLMEEMMK